MRPAILTRVTKIRHHGSDVFRRGALQRVDQDQHFHQRVIGRRTDGLQHKHIARTDVFCQLDTDFAVAEGADRAPVGGGVMAVAA